MSAPKQQAGGYPVSLRGLALSLGLHVPITMHILTNIYIYVYIHIKTHILANQEIKKKKTYHKTLPINYLSGRPKALKTVFLLVAPQNSINGRILLVNTPYALDAENRAIKL